MRHVLVFVVVASVALVALPSGFVTASENDSEVQAIDALAAAYRAAFSNADAKAVAALFVPDGDYIDSSGRIVRGREAIEKDYEGYFAVAGKAQLKAHRVSLRFLAPEVAMLDGVSEMVPPLVGPPSVSHFTVIAVKKSGHWLIQSVRENVTYPPSHYEHLMPLEWMIGAWGYSGQNGRIRCANVTCKWDLNKNYILYIHELEVEGEGSITGTQRIGWDPVANTIRSWFFTSAGDYTEGVWKQEGNRWIVTSKGTLGDGRKIASKNIISHVNDETFTFQSMDRTINGEPAPSVDTIEIKRKAN